MLKKDLIKEAQKHCDSSFTSTDPNSHYTAWNSMTSLIKKNLVFKENKLPARYKLTDEGRNLATTILNGAKENTDTSGRTSSPSPTTSKASKSATKAAPAKTNTSKKYQSSTSEQEDDSDHDTRSK